MNSKKGIFGYREGFAKLLTNQTVGWFEPSSFLLQPEGTLPEEETEKPRYIVARVFILIIAVLFLVRLMNLQIAQGSANRYLAEGNSIRRIITVAPRGVIEDRAGVPLVENEPGYNLEIIPADLPQSKDDRRQIFQQVSAISNLSVETIISKVDHVGLTSLHPIVLQADLTREDAIADQVKLANLSGVQVAFQPTRQYDTTPGLSHVLGYTSRMNDGDIAKHPDYSPDSPIGRSGIESSYDSLLRGKEGISEIEVNASGQFQRQLNNAPPQIGSTLHLTLDKGLQNEMAAALNEALQKNNVKEAVGIAMDPQTGGILASVSLPSYDNNLFAKNISEADFAALNNDPEKPLLNRTINGLYPSGSTIKPFVASAALQEGTITPSTKLDTSAGAIRIGQWTFPDWKVHGITDVKQALAQSNDIFFYALGGGYNNIQGLGVDRLKKYYTLFGFGQSTGLDYADDDTGLIPTPEWKKRVKKESWYIGDTYHISIGQGDLLVTPLQLARGLSSIANGGRLLTPHIVAATESPETGKVQTLKFPESKLNLSPSVLQTVQDGLRQTVASDTGSARTLRSLPFTSAGKTGTAQFGTEKKTHAWYIGYAPYEDPKIVVAIIVEGGGEGNAISVPVAGRVFSYYMSHIANQNQ